jgi:hypothetical protein
MLIKIMVIIAEMIMTVKTVTSVDNENPMILFVNSFVLVTLAAISRIYF